MSEVRRTPMYAQVCAYIRDKIREGKWKDGSRLPSENQLAQQFDVSRITIRGAMEQLVEEGAVYRIQGRGTFVAEAGTGKEPVRYASPDVTIRRETVQYAGPDASAHKELDLIALLIPALAGQLMTEIVRGVEEALSETRYRMLLITTGHSQQKEEIKLQEAIAAGASGMIVYPTVGYAYNEELLRLSIDRFPIVMIDRYVRGVEMNCVCSDHYRGAYEAVRHLLERGHRRIGYVTYKAYGTTSLEERLDGYRQALSDWGVVYDKSCLLELSDPAEMADFLRVQDDITALFIAQGELSRLVLEAAEQCGRTVPKQLALVRFDDYEAAADARLPLTCVAQQGELIGQEAISRLLSIIADPRQERQLIRLPTKLVIRASSNL